MNEDRRAVVNAVLHEVQFAANLDKQEAERVASSLLANPLWSLTPEQEYLALVEALEVGAELGVIDIPGHAEAIVRNFLQQVVSSLDERRPWPPLPFRELPDTRWREFAEAPVIARVEVDWPEIEARVGRIFTESVPDSRQFLLVQLRSGAEIGFVWSEQNHYSHTLITVPDTLFSRRQIVQEIVSITDLSSEEFVIFEEPVGHDSKI
ncbi:hypothetical protein ACLMAJ_19535 [Nocardia sp. KC 131]|uniref:hypothetical protein n=1 Tax=Nocardia arseniciresistens TaxID=3392119 RepID=UPI00398F4B3E